ncbi:MAG: class I SAM-dependent methyltransferase [Acidimicrobiales bacterium]
MDFAKVEELVSHMVGLMTGSAVVAGVIVGERLGLYRALAAADGPLSADELATQTGCHRRLTREWLDGQTGAGLLAFDDGDDTYSMSPEAALVLADEDSPAFLAGGVATFQAIYHAIPKLQAAFRGDGGIAWGDHHDSLYEGVARFFRPGYRTNLVTEWIPAMEGMAAKLTEGGTIADVGCGHGHSCTVMAEAFPAAEVWGFDFHGPSVEAARANVGARGLGGRVQFDVQSSRSYDGAFDLICFFDCLHDMGDPTSVAHHALTKLTPGGSVLLVEPFAMDGRRANLEGNPAAGFFYHASTFLCTPSSLAQEVGRAMGAQSGESGMRAVFEEAGYRTFHRIHESPFNIVYEAKA